MNFCLKQWQLSQNETDTNIAVSVPSDITNDLYKAGLIADPYYGYNHHKCYDLCRKDYIYTTTFDLPEKIDENNENLYVTFLGVDLFSDIYLNGKLIGKTDNMFKAYKFDISNVAKEKGNVIEVKMQSTITKMENMDCKNYFGVFNTPRVLLRKKQCDFGWDWAANIPGYGIWKDVIVYSESKECISDVRYVAGMDKKAIFVVDLNYCYRSHYDNNGNFVEIKNPHKDELKFSLSETPDGELKNVKTKIIEVNGRRHFVAFDNPNAELWWPNGYGKQPLYAYKIELIRDGRAISVKEGYMAYRSVELVQQAIDDEMLGYQIKINGKNVFIKGSNWVPVDCFTGAIKKEKYIKLISQAQRANYNMLRVWGGGVYENEIFYETCDKLGIMVWQDFMFACADIPDAEEDWLKNTVEECEYQIKRLRNYPSIVYWCGGNEKTGSFGSMIKCGDNFVDVTLRGLVGHLDGTRPYARQSPCSWTDIANDKNSGETHFSSFEPAIINGVLQYRKLVSREVVPFASENASLGPVSRQSYERIFPKEDLWPMTKMWNDRMLTNPYAAEKIMFCEAEKRFANELYGESKTLDAFVAKGMTAHAEMIRCEIEFQRCNKGITSGYMNWMYSDMWPTGTWAVIDYYTEPKQAYYQMARSYAPVLMTFVQNKDNELLLVGVNDTMKDVSAKFEYGQKSLDGKVAWSINGTATLGTEKAFVSKINKDIDTKNSYLFVTYTVNGETKTNVFSLDFWHNCRFASDYTVVAKAEGSKATVTIKANKFAKSVFISLPENYKYDYSDNYLDIEAGQEKTVVISSSDMIDESEIIVTDFSKASD